LESFIWLPVGIPTQGGEKIVNTGTKFNEICSQKPTFNCIFGILGLEILSVV
jgi:hypothetical protein